MSVTNSEVITFVNERIRPRSEQIRNLMHLLQDDKDKWVNGISTLVPDDVNEILDDGREDQGVSRLTGADINLVVNRIGQLLTILEAADSMTPVLKACVRPLPIG